MSTTSPRAQIARERLARVHAAQPETRRQAVQSWLEAATGAEVRRGWRSWMGTLPGWAQV